jgi:hypothetical protein
MRNISVLLGLSILLLVAGCKKSPELELDYIPNFGSNVKVVVSEKKIELKASFSQINKSNIEVCGFEVSENIGAKTAVYLALKPSSSEIVLQIDTALRESINYKTRAWIIVGSKKFYSSYSYFKGLGFPAPVITSVSKDYAFRGEVFFIDGKYFTDDFSSNGIVVKIDNIKCRIESATYNRIGVEMPDSKTRGKVKISLNVLGKDASEQFEIENYWPEIFSVIPQSMPMTGEITIKGKFHSEYNKFIFPVQYNFNSYDIVKYSDSEIIIKSSNYMNCDSLYSIYFYLSNVSGRYPEFLNTGFTVNRTGIWQRLNDVPFPGGNNGYFYYGVSCDGKGYVIQYTHYLPDEFLFWRYDPQTDNWTKLPPYPGDFRYYPVLVEHNGIIYFGSGINTGGGGMADFWKFNPVTSTWTKLADLNLENSSDNPIFGGIIQDELVVFSNMSNKLARYNEANNTWEMSDCAVPVTNYVEKFMFINNGNYYFIDASLIYQYNLTTQSFSLYYQDFNYAMFNRVFTKGNRVFTYGECKIGEVDMTNKRTFLVKEFSNYFSKDYYSVKLFAINDVTYFIIPPNKLCKFNLEK